jgi:citrate synthase
MQKFWHDNESLTPVEQQLVNLLLQAHHACTFRENCSTQALLQAGGGSGHLVNGLIAALATLGETHGPVQDAYEVLERGSMNPAVRTAGWGNSFVRGKPDPALNVVNNFLGEHWPQIAGTIDIITEQLHAAGKKVFPNPGCYTAAVAMAIGMPAYLAPLLFVEGRMLAWAMLFHQQKIQPTAVKQKEAV